VFCFFDGSIKKAEASEMCRATTPTVLYLLQDDTVQRTRISPSAGCDVQMTPVPKLHIQSITIVSQPSHGKVTQTSLLTAHYQPTPGFTGMDSYNTKICGTFGQKKGCTTAVNVMEVVN
jgi:hypothetical protein